MRFWLMIVLMGAVTFAIRLSMIALLGRVEIPLVVRRALKYVPVAVLSAIIAPELLLADGRVVVSLANERLLAGLLAAGVAWRTKNVLLTIGAGLAALWVLQSL